MEHDAIEVVSEQGVQSEKRQRGLGMEGCCGEDPNLHKAEIDSLQ